MKKVKMLVLALVFSMLFGMTAMASGSVMGDVELKTEKVNAKVVMDGETVTGEVETSLHYGAASGSKSELTADTVKNLTKSKKEFSTYIYRLALWMETGAIDEWGDKETKSVSLASGATMDLEFSVIGVTSKTEVYVLDYSKDSGWSNHGKVIEKGNGYIKVRFSSLQGGATLAILVESGEGSQNSVLAPAAAQTLKATPVSGKVNTIELNWEAVADADKYEIRYGTTADFNQAKKLTYTSKKSYRFTKAKCGVDYYFWIQASNKAGKSVWTTGGEACRTSLEGNPELTVKKQTYNSISLKWTKVTGAKKYMIYRVEEDGLKLLKTQSGTSYTDKKLSTGESYSYVVRPMRDWDYGEDNTSNMETGKTVLGSITKLKAKASGTDGIQLSWKKVPGVVKYEIYRLNEETGTFDLLRDNVIRANYKDTNLQAGKSYSYKVVGWTSGGQRATSTIDRAEIVIGVTKQPK